MKRPGLESFPPTGLDRNLRFLERAKAGVAVRVRRRRNGGEGTAPEVLLGEEDLGRVLRQALDHVTPLAGELDGGLAALHSGVHRQHLVEAEELGDVLLVRAEAVVVERPGGECDGLRLLGERGDDLGVAVPLVDRRVRGQEVEILLAVNIPDLGALALGQNRRERMVAAQCAAGVDAR